MIDIKEKIQYQQYIISRFDAYYDSINNKGNFLVAFHSFLIGAVILGNSKITDYIDSNEWKFVSQILLVVLIGCALLSIYWLLRAMYPFTKSGNTTATGYHSLIFFKSIRELNDPNTYLLKLNQANEDDFFKDLAFQAYQLADGLDCKFSMLSKATTLIYLQGVLLISILLIVILK